MKRILLFGVVASLSFSLLGCTVEASKGQVKDNQNKQVEQNIDQDKFNKEQITDLVEGFGGKLQHVSLLSPGDLLEKSMKENYGDFVSPELLEKWIQNPESAIGRLTSSPWPDRIEIQSIDQLSEEEYEVKGEIIEITNNKEDKLIRQPIELNVKKIEDQWMIDAVTVREYK